MKTSIKISGDTNSSIVNKQWRVSLTARCKAGGVNQTNLMGGLKLIPPYRCPRKTSVILNYRIRKRQMTIGYYSLKAQLIQRIKRK